MSTTLDVHTHASAGAQRQAVIQLEDHLFPSVPKSSAEEEMSGIVIH
jgi:hypothetical protein